MPARPLRDVDPVTLSVLLPVALGPAALATLAGEVGLDAGEAVRTLVLRIRSDLATETAVHRRLAHELPDAPVPRTVASLGAWLRVAVLERDYRGMAAVTWVAATTAGLAWRRLEERGRGSLVSTALWSLRERMDAPSSAIAAK